MARWTRDDIDSFIKDVDKYELIEIVEFKGASSLVKVRCLKNESHEPFIVTFSNLRSNETRGRTVGCCQQCLKDARGGYTRRSLDEVRQYVEERGYFLLSDTYLNQETPLTIECPCGNIFKMTYNNFRNGGQGCPKCGKRRRAEGRRHSYEHVKSVFDELGCTLISKEYRNALGQLEVYCPIHKEIFISTLQKAQNGQGCRKCGIERRTAKLRHDLAYVQEYISSNGEILLSTRYSNNLEKLEIRCENGHTYQKSFGSYVSGHRCHFCHLRKGEEEIKKVLDCHSIQYIHNKGYFPDLCGEGGKPLRPDFILEERRVWIEYDGEQHYQLINFGGVSEEEVAKNFRKTKRYDELKNSYAKKNGWKLIRIPYWELKNIESILVNQLNLE